MAFSCSKRFFINNNLLAVLLMSVSKACMVEHPFLEFLILCSSNLQNFHCPLQRGEVSFMDYLLEKDASFCTLKSFVLFCLFSFAVNVERTLSIKMPLCPSTEQKMNLLVTTDLVCEDEVEAWIYFKGHSHIFKNPILKHCCMFLKLLFSAS